MSWTTTDFDHVNGTKHFLQRLVSSLLVRQTLPNAAATCQQYFSFCREQHEAMNSFLVREALGYSEFVEALLLLYEDKQGIKQREQNIDLPDKEPRSEHDDWWNYDYQDTELPPAPEDGLDKCCSC